MDISAFVKPEYRPPSDDPMQRGRVWFSVDPDMMYPAVLKEMNALGKLTKDECDLACMPYRLSRRDDPLLHARRAEIIKSARLLFTAFLRENAKQPIGVHILKGSGQWRE
jgi:hypothetical protein